MAVLTGKARAALKDSDFAYVEPGHAVNGVTPDKYRHYPIHDKAHVTAALRLRNSPFWDKAKGKVMAAAKKHGIQHDAGSETGRSLESLYPEMRFLFDQPEFRMVGEGENATPHIAGYAAVFVKEDGSPAISRRLGGFQEVVDKRAFNDAMEKGFPDVVCRYNHRDDMVLGTTAAGTLTLEVDERGLRYDVNPPRTRGDVTELIMRGDVRYSSFAFRCNEPGVDDTWGVTDYNYPLRKLNKVQLVDVAPVMDPAYFDTSAAARSMGGAVESLARFVNADPDEVRSYLAAGQAIKFFKRSDRSSEIPEVSKDAAETRVYDDPAVALRNNWKKDEDAPADETEEPSEETPEEQNSAPEESTDEQKAEIRAALKTADQICNQYTDGEPCVRPQGHKGDHAGPCWGRKGGLPCCKPQGHHMVAGDEAHEPMHVMSRDGSEAEGAPEETRNAEAEARAFEDQIRMDEVRAQLAAMELDD
jgi:uncharacterized protein